MAQEIVVAVIVIGATLYLVRALVMRSRGAASGCDGNCGNCALAGSHRLEAECKAAGEGRDG